MSEPEQSQPESKKLKQFYSDLFAHPATQAISFVIGLAGLIFGFYSFYANVREPNLTYYISPTRTPIVQSGKLDNFSLSYYGNVITNDLSGAEIQIWNEGKSPISKNDILKTIVLKTPHGEPIYKIVSSTTRDVIGYNATNESAHQAGELPIEWNILEHRDGIKLQIIYGGSVKLPLTLEGVVKGQQQGLQAFKAENSNKTQELYKTVSIILSILICMVAFLAVSVEIISRIFTRFVNKDWGKSSSYRAAVASASLFLTAFLMVLLFYIMTKMPLIMGIKPPFGL